MATKKSKKAKDKKIEDPVQEVVVAGPVEQKEEEVKFNSVRDIFVYLNDKGIDFWLLKDNCYDCVILYKISNSVSIGVRSDKDKETIVNILNSTSINFDIEVEPNRVTKDFGVDGVPVKVPLPVVIYLEGFCKKPWAVLDNMRKK